MPDIFLRSYDGSPTTIFLYDPTKSYSPSGNMAATLFGLSSVSVFGNTFYDTQSSPAPLVSSGAALGSSGVSQANPAIILTASNSLQLFPLPSQFLGALNGYRLFQNNGCSIAAGGYVSVPPSAVNVTADFVLMLNSIQNPTPPLIAAHPDVMATLPLGDVVSIGITPWSFTCRLSAQQQRSWNDNKMHGQLRVDYQINIGGSSFSGASYSSNDPYLTPVTQFSIGFQFSGSVSGSDAFQASLFYFETRK